MVQYVVFSLLFFWLELFLTSSTYCAYKCFWCFKQLSLEARAGIFMSGKMMSVHLSLNSPYGLLDSTWQSWPPNPVLFWLAFVCCLQSWTHLCIQARKAAAKKLNSFCGQDIGYQEAWSCAAFGCCLQTPRGSYALFVLPVRDTVLQPAGVTCAGQLEVFMCDFSAKVLLITATCCSVSTDPWYLLCFPSNPWRWDRVHFCLRV